MPCACNTFNALQGFEKAIAQLLLAAPSMVMIVTSRNHVLFTSHQITTKAIEVQELAAEDAEKMMAVCSAKHAKGHCSRAGSIVRQCAHCFVCGQQVHCQLGICSKGDKTHHGPIGVCVSVV